MGLIIRIGLEPLPPKYLCGGCRLFFYGSTREVDSGACAILAVSTHGGKVHDVRSIFLCKVCSEELYDLERAEWARLPPSAFTGYRDMWRF